MKKTDKKLFLAGIILSSFLAGIFWRPPDASAFQIKRVIRGSTTLGNTVEAKTLDLGPAGDGKLAAGDGFDLTKTVLFITRTSNTGISDSRQRCDIMASIDDPKTLLFARRSAGNNGSITTIEYQIVEFASGVKVISGITSIPETAALIKNITIPSVTLGKAFPIIYQRTWVSDSAVDENGLFSADLTSATNLAITRSETAPTWNIDLAYQVLSFDSAESDVEVQKGSFCMNNTREYQDPSVYRETTDDGQTITINLTDFSSQFHSVDAAKSFLVMWTRADPATNGDERIYGIDGTVTNNNTLTFTRTMPAGTTTSATVNWYLVTFKNNAFVQKGRKTPVTTTSNIVSADGYSIPTFTNRSFGLVSVSNAGTSGAYTTGLDENNYRVQLNSSGGNFPASNTFTVTRESADTSNSSISWFVTELPPLNMVYPNGGETGANALRVGQTPRIRWEHAKELEANGSASDGSVKVSLRLDKNSGADGYPLAIVSGISSKLDYYDWNILATLNPGSINVIGNKLRIRIQCDEFVVGAEKTITNASNQTPIRITSAGHGLVNGEVVTIYNSSLTYLNKGWTISYVDANNFDLVGSQAQGSVGNDGKFRNLTRSYDDSNADFEIKGGITVNKPDSTVNSASPWLIGQTKAIEWTPTGNLNGAGAGKVKIQICTDGSNWDTLVDLIDAGADGVKQSWSWTIPSVVNARGVIGSDNIIKVTFDSGYETEVTVASSANNGGSGLVEVTASTDHGYSTGDWVNISGHTPAAGINSNWKITKVSNTKFTLDNSTYVQNGSGGTVKRPTADSVVSGQSPAFWIMGQISNVRVTDIATGNDVTSCLIGNTYRIKWEKKGYFGGTSDGNVRIFYSSNSGDSYPTELKASTPAGTDTDGGYWDWPVASLAETPASFVSRVKVISNDAETACQVSNTSAVDFVLRQGTLELTKPDLATYNIGQTMDITWNPSPNLSHGVDIYFSSDNGGNWVQIKHFDNIQNPKTYNWTVGESSTAGTLLTNSPVTAVNQGKIKIIAEDFAITKISGGFTVQGSIDVTAPDGTAVWEIGDTNKPVNWTQVGTFPKVKISVSRTLGGGDWVVLDADVDPATEKPYLWPQVVLPASQANKALIKVEHAQWPSIFDTSAGFTIQETISNIANPANLIWRVSEKPTITWSVAGTLTKVDILYKKGTNDPVYLTPSDTGVDATFDGTNGSWNWTPYNVGYSKVPDDISAGAADTYIIVRDHSRTNISGQNPTAFKIKGAITSVSAIDPTVSAGAPVNISFTVAGNIGTKTVKAWLATNGGASYGTTPIATKQVTGAGTYDFPTWYPLGTDKGEDYVILVAVDTEENLTTGIAKISNEFDIVPKITINYPNETGLPAFNMFDTIYIKWTTDPPNNNFGELRIEYKNGSSWEAVMAGTVPANNVPAGEADVGYKWLLNNENYCGTNIKLRIYQNGKLDTISDTSVYGFDVLGGVQLKNEALLGEAHDGGLTPWTMEEQHSIEWTPKGTIGPVDIKYSTSGPPYNNYVKQNYDSALGSYSWTIKYTDKTPPPEGYVNFEKSQTVTFKIQTPDDKISDISQGNTTITSKIKVSKPTGQNPILKIFAPGDTPAEVDWLTYDVCDAETENCATAQDATSVPTVNIKYDTNGGSGEYDGEVKLGYGNLLGYGWQIPATVPIGKNFKVKVSSAAFPEIADVSPSPFRVIGQIRIDSPKTGQDAWLVDRDGVLEKVEQIKWTNYGNLGYGVTIWYSPTGVFTLGNYDVLTTAGSGDDGPQSMDFHILESTPSRIRSTNTIKIMDNNPDVDPETGLRAAPATSDPFTIKGQIQLLEPKGGEAYSMGEDIPVRWKYAGNIGGLFFKYSPTGADGSWILINTESIPVTNDPDLIDVNINSYPWKNIPDAGNYYFKIEPAIVGKCDPVVSAGVFNISGSVRLDSPGKNAGNPETWFVDGETNEIRWTPLGGTQYVDLALERDTRGVMTIANNVPAIPSSFIWDISAPSDEAKRVAATSNYCKIRISVSGAPNKGDVSTNYFKIKPRVALDALANLPWKVQTNNTITWTKQGRFADGELRIYFINGADQQLIATANEGDLSCGWTINPNVGGVEIPKITDDGKIRIIRYCDNGLGVMEEDTQVKFEKTVRIVGRINVTSPVGQTTYNAGGSGTISWQVTKVTEPLEIRYSTTYFGDPLHPENDFPPASFTNIITGDIPYTETSKTFTVPLEVSQNVKFAVCQANKFTEVYGQSPKCIIKGGLLLDTNTTQLKNLTVGAKHTFSWVPTGTFTKLKAYYIIDGEKKAINENIPGGDTSVDWYPGDNDISDNILFRIEDTTDISDQTPADKKNNVKGTFAIKSPTGSTNNMLTVGQTGAFIKWLKQGDMGTLLIQLYQDNVLVNASDAGLASATAWEQGDSGVETNANFNWTIPDKIGAGNCKIKITPSKHPELAQESALFSIKGGFIANSVTSPLSSGNDIWYVGEGARDITWQAKGHMRKVRLELSIVGGDPRPYITNNPIIAEVTPVDAGTDTYKYNWAFAPAAQSGLADQRSNDCKIHIIDVDNPTSVLESSLFTIKPKIVVKPPTEEWIANTQPKIDWEDILGDQTSTIDILLDTDADGFIDGGDQVLASGISKSVSRPYTSLITLSPTVTNTAVIRIQDNNSAVKSFVYGESTIPFPIKGSIQVDTPATMTRDETNKVISWTYKGSFTQVNIWADYNGDGTDDEKLTATPVSAGSNGNGSWTWLTIPDQVSNDVILKVVAVGVTETQVPPGKTQKFKILGKIEVTSPNGAPVHIEDDSSESVDIKWKSWGQNISKVKLEYSLNGSDADPTYQLIAASVDNNNRNGSAENSWPWNSGSAVPIPRNVSSKDVKIRVSAATPAQPETKDECNLPFVICGTIYPEAIANPVWLVDGTTANTISWKFAGQIDTVAVYYAKDGLTFGATPIVPSANAHTIGDPDPTHGSCTWTVPATFGVNDNWLSNGPIAKVRIQDTRDDFKVLTVEDSSAFTVKGILTFSAQTVSDLAAGLIAGVEKQISWERKGKIASVEVRYSNDNGVAGGGTFPLGNTIGTVNFGTGATASINWMVPEYLGAPSKNNGYALRVKDSANPNSNTQVISDPFTVRGDIKYMLPIADKVFIGSSQTITWNILHGEILSVKVIGSRDGNFDDHGVPNSDMFTIRGSTDADNVSGFTATPAPGEPVAKGSCSWTIQELDPSILTNTLKIKVVDADPAYSVMNGTFATSGAFTIKGALSVDKPTEDWNVGDMSRSIIWTPQGNITKFKIFFSPQNGDAGTWVPVTPPGGTSGTNEAGGKKSYSTGNWYHTDSATGVPDVKSKECKLKVCDFDNEDEVFAVTSDADKFNVYPKITNVTVVASPGTDTLDPGYKIWRAVDDVQVKWIDTSTKVGSVKIFYSPNGIANFGADAIFTATSTVNGENTASFTSPAGLSNGRNALIRVKDVDAAFADLVYADSALFRVVGRIDIDNDRFIDDWKVGDTTKKIAWTAFGTELTGVDIYIDYGSGYGTSPIASLTTESGTAKTWDFDDDLVTPGPQVGDHVTQHAKIRIQDSNAGRKAYTQFESSEFNIAGILSNLTVTPALPNPPDNEDAPVADEAGAKVSWTKVGAAISHVKLYYSNNDGATGSWVPINGTDGLVLAGEVYPWKPPAGDILNQKAKLKVYDPNNEVTTTCTIAAPFSIKSKVEVTTPNETNVGANGWEIGKSHTIKWNLWGDIENVNIYYRAKPTDTWGDPVASNQPAHKVGDVYHGEYSWYILPNTALGTGTAEIKVVDAAQKTLSIPVISKPFTTQGSVLVLEPDNSKRYTVGTNTPITITWERVGDIQGVDVWYSTNGGSTWGEGTAQRIAYHDEFPNGQNTDSIQWSAPENGVGYEYVIEVKDMNNALINNRSPQFAIGGDLAITKPELAGVSYEISVDNQEITWDVLHGNVGTVDVIGSRSGTFSGVNDIFPIAQGVRADNVTEFSPTTTPKARGKALWDFPEQSPTIVKDTIRVRIFDSDTVHYPEVQDTTTETNPCTIKGRFQFLQPTVLNTLQCDKDFIVRWNTFGAINAVKLQWKTENSGVFADIPGASIVNIPGSDVEAGVTQHTWKPDGKIVGVASQAQIRILQTDGTAGKRAFLDSAQFPITGWFDFGEGDLPSAGNSWEIQPQTPYLISWNNHGVETPIVLQYYDGTQYQDITTSPIVNVDFNGKGYYNWSPGASTKLTKYSNIRVYKSGDLNNKAVSGDFSLHGKVSLVAPTGEGEDARSLKFGGSYPVRFGVVKGQGMKVRLDYSVVSGTPQPADFTYTLVPEVTLSAGGTSTYTWNVSQPPTGIDVQSKNVVIRVSDTADAENCYATTSPSERFRIQCTFDVTKPNGAPWQVGDPGIIEWKSLTGTSNYVNIWYTADSDAPSPSWVKLNTSAVDNSPVGNLHTFTWSPIENPRSDNCMIKVTDSRDDLAEAFSPGFPTRGGIKILDPDIHKDLDIGGQHTIKWNVFGDIKEIKIYYSLDGSLNYLAHPGNPIKEINDTEGNRLSDYDPDHDGTYEYIWNPIPDKAHKYVSVVIANPDAMTEYDISTEYSTIRAILQIDDLDPLLRVQDSLDPECVPELITWSLQGTISDVKLEYSLDNFATAGIPIVAAYDAKSTPNGTPNGKYGYEWYVPKEAMCKTDAARVRVRISSSDQTNEPSNISISNPFVVKGSIEMLHPHTGVELDVDDNTYDIEWKTMGDLNTITNAKLKLLLSVDGQPEHGSTVITSVADPGSHNTKPTFRWPQVPNLIHTDKVLIKGVLVVGSDEDSVVWDWTSPFTIRAKLKLLFPNGPTDYIIHQKANQFITWEKHGSLATDTVDIDLYDTANNKLADIADDVSAAGIFPWSNLPAALNGDDYIIKVFDHALNAEHDGANCKTLNAESAAAFKIRGSLTFDLTSMPSPISGNPNNVWMIGDTKAIRWTKAGPVSTVILEYSKDSGGSYSKITDVNGNPVEEIVLSGSQPYSFNWKVPQAAKTTTAKLRIREKRSDEIIDVKDIRPTLTDTFIIRGGFTWQEPVADPVQEYELTQPVQLRWSPFGSMTAVRLEFSMNNFNWYPVGTDAIISGSTLNKIFDLNPTKFGLDVGPCIIRLQDTEDSNAEARINIKIKGKIEFTSPVGSPTWKAGEPATISWNPLGEIGLVKIEYIGGASGGGIIAEHVSSSAGSCLWPTIPAGAVGAIKIRITQETSNPPMWETAGWVSVAANFVFEEPTASTTWYVDDPANIRWTTFGDVAKVDLKYWATVNSVSHWEPIVFGYDNNITGNRKTTYPWPHVPDNMADNVKIQISGGSTVAESYPFKILGSITLNEPTAPLKIGRSYTISWTEKGHAPFVEIEFDSGAGTIKLNNGQPIANPPTKSYTWTSVADVLLPCEVARFHIKTVGYDIQDSTEFFKVVPDFTFLEPGPNDIFQVTDDPANTTIKWTCTSAYVARVNLDYAIVDNPTPADFRPVTVGEVANPTGSPGLEAQYPWSLTKLNDCSSTAYIRITAKINGATVQGQTTSDKFYLRPILTLQAPNGNEKFVIGRVNYITWTCAGKLTPVKLEYSYSGNFDDTQPLPLDQLLDEVLVSNTEIAPAVNQYAWTIPDGLFAESARIRVCAPDGKNGKDESLGTFKIVAGFSIDAPLENEEYKVGENIPIKWKCASSGSNVPKVNLAYSTDNGLSYTIFEQEVVNPAIIGDQGQFIWLNFPGNLITKTAKIKVIDWNDEHGFEESKKFVIKANLDFLSPGDGLSPTLTVGDPLELRWKCTGDVATVKFQYSFNQSNPNSWIDLPGAESVDNPVPEAGIRKFSVPGGVPDIIGTTVWFRVSDYVPGHPASYAESVNPVRVKGALNITSPRNVPDNKLEMEIGKPFDITWTAKGSIPAVILEYDYTDKLGVIHTASIDTINVLGYRQPDGSYKYPWPAVPDSASGQSFIRIRDSRTVDFPEVISVSDVFRIKGYIKVISPNGGDDVDWKVGEDRSIEWEWGGTMTSMSISLSTTGKNGVYSPIPLNSVVDTSGAVYVDGKSSKRISWKVPDAISKDNAFIKVSYTGDKEVFDTSDEDFTIYGGFEFTSPQWTKNERWVTNETTHKIQWVTTGTIPVVDLEYIKYDAQGKVLVSGGINEIEYGASNTGVNLNTHSWKIPDDRCQYVKVRISDPRDPDNTTEYSDYFRIDYYLIKWDIRDLLTNERTTNVSVIEKVTGGTAVSWQAGGLNPIVDHWTPYGLWTSVWSGIGYGDKGQNYTANKDQTLTVYLETSAVHIWRSSAEFTYDAKSGQLKILAYLERDGSVVQGAEKIGVYIYDDTGTIIPFDNVCEEYIDADTGELKGDFWNKDTSVPPDNIKDTCDPKPTLFSTTIGSSGYFSLTLPPLPAPYTLKEGKVYAVLVDIMMRSKAHFRTPTSFSITEAKLLDQTATAVDTMTTSTLPAFQGAVTGAISKGIIDQKKMITDIMVGTDGDPDDIMSKGGMVGIIQDAMVTFGKDTSAAIGKLQSGADTAVAAGLKLEATAKQFSWKGQVAPDPALAGDMISLKVQGQPSSLIKSFPLVTIYSWDNKAIVADVMMTENRPGFYVYDFLADARFAVGKAYTFMVTEQVTGGLISGSGMVESMGITTVAGLAAAAPEAERAAKKALEAIKAIESVLVSNENINISLTLKNLKESVDALPETLNKEGPNTAIMNAINDISSRLSKIMGQEGMDFSSLLDEKLGDTSSMKQLRNKTDTINAIVDLLLQIMEAKLGGVDSPIISTSLQSGSVKFRIMAVNPSKTKIQRVQVKKYLPEEVKPKDVMDLGGLELEYDSEKAIYYVYKNDLEMQPNQINVFEVEVEDIWMVPDSQLAELKKRTDEILALFGKSPLYSKAKEVTDTIYPVLEEMPKAQLDDTISREQHIGIYRQNQQNIKTINEKLAELEKMLVPENGKPTPNILERSKLKINLPSKSTTWLIILVVIIFLGIFAGIFFFVWQGQIKSSQELIKDAAKSSFPGQKPEDKAGTPPK